MKYVLVAAAIMFVGTAQAGVDRMAFVHKMEMIGQIQRGEIKTDPRFGITYKYLKTEVLPNNIYAVFIQDMTP